MKFNQKIAKQIAQRQFNWTIGCVIGTDDPDYTFDTPIEDLEQNFEEDLEEIGIKSTPKRIESIKKHYERMVNKAIDFLKKQQNPIYMKDMKS